MVYTKEKFKELWDSDEDGGGITYEDIIDCAKDWGLSDDAPKTHITMVMYKVLKAADCKDI